MKIYRIFFLGLILSCTDIDISQNDTFDNEGENDFLEKSAPTSCSQRWIPTSLLTDLQHEIMYEQPSRNCSQGAQIGAIEFGNYIRENFGQLMNLNIDSGGIQIYNCRSVRGDNAPSVHSEGRAIDIFIPMRNGVANNINGDIIANWLIDNAKKIGIQYIIWDRTSWKASGIPSQKCYTGSHPHNDHIHVELTWQASQKQTPFFNQGISNPDWSNPATSQNHSSQNTDKRIINQVIKDMQQQSTQQTDMYFDSQQTQNTQQYDMQISNISSQNNFQSWIGDPCINDLDCIFSIENQIGKCFLEHLPSSGIGFCSISCNGFCPDITNAAPTFCVASNDLNLNAGGICMSKSCSNNDYCQRYSGFKSATVNRYIGNSSAYAMTADVCIPIDNAMSIGTGNGSSNEGVCYISDIPFGDNNDSCLGISNETWRCACSQRLETVVSQVCRNNVWINFETNPSNCDRCNGIYTSGCNQ